ncbi:UNKNOWN [Stylonychia lemnae]|uniref:Uncharacterized protein n=1 Tax=Stylonychia lemnae TaxID=5949 RepID=A0A078ALT3_STYLE|nr:UNKNOWN [Stylonychia lemnae]|eukprot:CDW83320.1 UNKNOWN [Stylonychia lemnae]
MHMASGPAYTSNYSKFAQVPGSNNVRGVRTQSRLRQLNTSQSQQFLENKILQDRMLRMNHDINHTGLGNTHNPKHISEVLASRQSRNQQHGSNFSFMSRRNKSNTSQQYLQMNPNHTLRVGSHTARVFDSSKKPQTSVQIRRDYSPSKGQNDHFSNLNTKNIAADLDEKIKQKENLFNSHYNTQTNFYQVKIQVSYCYLDSRLRISICQGYKQQGQVDATNAL